MPSVEVERAHGHPVTSQWRRLVTSDRLDMILGSVAKEYSPLLTTCKENQASAAPVSRTAQQWFEALPEGTAKSIMQLRKSTLHVMSIQENSPVRPVRPPACRPHDLDALHNMYMASNHKFHQAGRMMGCGCAPEPPAYHPQSQQQQQSAGCCQPNPTATAHPQPMPHYNTQAAYQAQLLQAQHAQHAACPAPAYGSGYPQHLATVPEDSGNGWCKPKHQNTAPGVLGLGGRQVVVGAPLPAPGTPLPPPGMDAIPPPPYGPVIGPDGQVMHGHWHAGDQREFDPPRTYTGAEPPAPKPWLEAINPYSNFNYKWNTLDMAELSKPAPGATATPGTHAPPMATPGQHQVNAQHAGHGQVPESQVASGMPQAGFMPGDAQPFHPSLRSDANPAQHAQHALLQQLVQATLQTAHLGQAVAGPQSQYAPPMQPQQHSYYPSYPASTTSPAYPQQQQQQQVPYTPQAAMHGEVQQYYKPPGNAPYPAPQQQYPPYPSGPYAGVSPGVGTGVMQVSQGPYTTPPPQMFKQYNTPPVHTTGYQQQQQQQVYPHNQAQGQHYQPQQAGYVQPPQNYHQYQQQGQYNYYQQQQQKQQQEFAQAPQGYMQQDASRQIQQYTTQHGANGARPGFGLDSEPSLPPPPQQQQQKRQQPSRAPSNNNAFGLVAEGNVGSAAPRPAGYGLDSEQASGRSVPLGTTAAKPAAFGLEGEVTSPPSKQVISGPGPVQQSRGLDAAGGSFGGFGVQQQPAIAGTVGPAMNKAASGQNLNAPTPATPTKIGYGLQDEVLVSSGQAGIDVKKSPTTPSFGLEQEVTAKATTSTTPPPTHASSSSSLAGAVAAKPVKPSYGMEEEVSVAKAPAPLATPAYNPADPTSGPGTVGVINKDVSKSSSGGFGLADELDTKPKAPLSTDLSKPSSTDRSTVDAFKPATAAAPAPKSKGLSFGLVDEDSSDDVQAKKPTSAGALPAVESGKDALNKTSKSPLAPKVLPSSTSKAGGSSDDDDDDAGMQRSALKAKSVAASFAGDKGFDVNTSVSVKSGGGLASEASKGKLGGLAGEKSKGNISGGGYSDDDFDDVDSPRPKASTPAATGTTPTSAMSKSSSKASFGLGAESNQTDAKLPKPSSTSSVSVLGSASRAVSGSGAATKPGAAAAAAKLKFGLGADSEDEF